MPRALQRLLLFTGDSDSDQIKVIKLIKTSDKSVNGDPARTWINLSNSDLSCQEHSYSQVTVTVIEDGGFKDGELEEKDQNKTT